jgi:23S rRNA pseudouridine1911/1915/1917 synthase
MKVVPKVIFEDNVILVVDKPSGWVTTFVTSAKDSEILESWLSKNFRYKIATDKEYRSGIVHRLDKETSGVLAIAKTKDAFEFLQKQFKKRKVSKKYLALLHGKLEPREGDISAPVARLPWRRDRFGVVSSGKSAQTNYKVNSYHIKPDNNQTYSYVSVYPKTGRTHQIRVHMKRLGHPVISDEFYAGRKTARNDREWCPRLFLHANELKINHPTTHEETAFTSDLPDDLRKVLDLLEKPHENQ